MYHIGNHIRRALLAGLAVALCAAAAHAQSDPNKCRVEISKQLAKYEASVNKALNKCELGRVKGKILTTCALDTKTNESIEKSAGKVIAGITKKCAGLSFEEMGWANCPDIHGAGCDTQFTGSYQKGVCAGGTEEGENCTSDPDCPGSSCTISIDLAVPADETEIGFCINCNVYENVAAYMDLIYGGLNDSSADKDLNKCQQEVGKQLSKVFAAFSKEAGKCAKTRPSQGGVCPETKSLAKITKTYTKAVEAILVKKCSGFSLAQIGLAGTCPAAASRGLGATATDCSALTITDVESYLACAACNASQTVLDEFSGTCGDGITQFEVGETCDDGNQLDGDSCPSDCRISECRIDTKGKTQDIVVSFSVPAGEEVAGLEAFVAYPERAVTLPGFGDVSGDVSAITNASLTVVDTNAGLSVIVLDSNLDPIPAGDLFSTTFSVCTSLGKGQANLAAAWEGAKVKGAKSDDFVCVVDSAVDGNLNPVDGVTCSVEFP